jgi:hypothetical protein
MLEGCRDHPLVGIGGRRRDHLDHQPHRGFLEQTRRFARAVATDHAAHRIRRAGDDAGLLEGARIDGVDMAAGAGQHHRTIR